MLRRLLALLALASPVAAQCEGERISASPPETFGLFGRAAAIEGDRALVGAYGTANDAAGAAYVFERVGGGPFAQVAVLGSSDGEKEDFFGFSVDLSGPVAVIGAPQDDDLGEDAGAAYVFERSGTAWAQVAKLLPPTGGVGDRFGTSVGIDGDRIVVGAPERTVSLPLAGRAHVFERVGSTWTHVQTLGASDEEAEKRFGTSVAISNSQVLVGAVGDGGGPAGPGAAYVFRRSAAGSWTEIAKLVAGDADPFDEFGTSVALDANVAVVGDPADSASVFLGGAAHVFERSGGAWVEVAKLVSPDLADSDMLGHRVALSGGRAVVGVPLDDGVAVPDAGAAWLFERGATGWSASAKLTPSEPDLLGSEAGTAVAIDGETAVVGAMLDSGPTLLAGAAYVFDVVPRAALTGTPAAISLFGGGTQTFELSICPQPPGWTLYFLLGSASPTSPLGLPVDGVLLPLTFDVYFLHTLTNPNAPPLAGSLGMLDAKGEATASFTLPAGTMPALAGLALEHAFLVFDVSSAPYAALASPAVGVSLMP